MALTGILSSLESRFLNIISAFLLHLCSVMYSTAQPIRTQKLKFNPFFNVLLSMYQVFIISFNWFSLSYSNNDHETLIYVYEAFQPHCNWLRWFNIIDKHSEDTWGFYMSSPHVKACICGYQATGGPCEIWSHDKSFLTCQSIYQPVPSSVTSLNP